VSIQNFESVKIIQVLFVGTVIRAVKIAILSLLVAHGKNIVDPEKDFFGEVGFVLVSPSISVI
jgi:hypothetical protein